MIDLAKLRKVHAMTTSPNPHEAAVAWSKVDGILKAGGKTRRALPGLLKGSTEKPVDPPQGAGGFSPFAGFDDWMEEKEPGYRARMARERAEKRQREKDELADLLRRYGSMEALEADNAMEAAIEAAAGPFKGKVKHQFANGVFEVDGLDGWYDSLFIDRAPERVKAAIAKAIPMPVTVTEAKAEYDAWDARDRELGLAWGRLDDNQLSLPCRIRQEMVRRLFETGLRSRTMEEVLVRQRHLLDSNSGLGIEEAVLADLEALAASVEGGIWDTPSPAPAIPPEVDVLDAPRGMPGDQPIGWARGWNACREAMMKPGTAAADVRLNGALDAVRRLQGCRSACQGDALDCPCLTLARQVLQEEAAHG
ncbi:hypothetical protein [Roseomonas xinghualingensis]|uniref:hypothetical protein n=1 Tax=Roseomonas xinghualingensis TaxID=2986475 RepID=UPI0021F1E3A1|nr:hypothetical protein [Roseomonas sp. SXEYE001]MCV4209346.1 hypothetical protein [Roseomonas sp. SXEYE001]